MRVRALLSEGSQYGLRLREEFEDRTGEVWPLNVGQIRTTLQRLERDGLAGSDGSGEEVPEKAFRVTSDGQRELAAWLRTPPGLSSPPRDELVMKVLIVLRVPGADPHEVIMAARGGLAPARGDHVVRASPRGLTPPAGLTRGRRRVPHA